MKTRYTLLSLFLTGLSFSAIADRYEFIAGDSSLETQTCIAAATDDKLGLRKTVRKMPMPSGVFRTEHARMKGVANGLKCNGDVIATFARKYDALITYEYLNKYTRSDLRLKPTTSIRDITARTKTGNSDRVIQVFVASR